MALGVARQHVEDGRAGRKTWVLDNKIELRVNKPRSLPASGLPVKFKHPLVKLSVVVAA